MAYKKQDKAKEDIQKLKQELEEVKKRYLRALADYQNLQKRVEKEKELIAFEATAKVIKDFLEIFDDLEKAEIFVKDKGLSLIKDKFKKLFKKWGVEEIKIKGEKFDPQLAEVVDTIEGEDNKVVKVFQKGYKLNGRVLRVAKVQVSKKVKS